MSNSRQGSSHGSNSGNEGGAVEGGGEIYDSRTPLAAQFLENSQGSQEGRSSSLPGGEGRYQQEHDYSYHQHQQQQTGFALPHPASASVGYASEHQQQRYAHEYQQQQQYQPQQQASYPHPPLPPSSGGFYRGRSTSSYPSAMPLYSSHTGHAVSTGYYQTPPPTSAGPGPSTGTDAQLQYLPLPQQQSVHPSFGHTTSSGAATGVPLFPTSVTTSAYPSGTPYYQQQQPQAQAYGAEVEASTAPRIPAGLPSKSSASVAVAVPAASSGMSLSSLVLQRSYSSDDERYRPQSGMNTGSGSMGGARTPTAGNFASTSRTSSHHSHEQVSSRPGTSTSHRSGSIIQKLTSVIEPDEHVRRGGKTYHDLYGEGEDDDFNPDQEGSGGDGGDESMGVERTSGEGREFEEGKKAKGKGGKTGPKSGVRLSNLEKKARNRESSQRFRNKAKERSTAIRERMKWLEDRVKSLEQELVQVRSGDPCPSTGVPGSATASPPDAAVQLYETGHRASSAGVGQNTASADSTIVMLRRENERLARSLRIAEDELLDKIEQLRLSPPSPPHSWPYPHGGSSVSSVGPMRRHSGPQHQRQRTSHSRISSYGSSVGSGSIHSSLSQPFDSSVPSSISNLSHAAQVFNRARSGSLASSVTTADSSQATGGHGGGTASGSPRSFYPKSTGGPLSRSASLSSHYQSSLPTVPGSATLPTASFAEYQDAGPSCSSTTTGPVTPLSAGTVRTRPPGGMYYNAASTTPTIASPWQTGYGIYHPQQPYQQQYCGQPQQYPSSSSSSLQTGHTRAVTENSPLTGQFANYPSYPSASAWQPIPTPAPSFVDPLAANLSTAVGGTESRPASGGVATPFLGTTIASAGYDQAGEGGLAVTSEQITELASAPAVGYSPSERETESMDIAVTGSGTGDAQGRDISV